MKFKHHILIVLLTVGIFASCVRDLDVSEPEYSDVGWVTSEFRSGQFTAGVNSFITFSNLSVNEVEHKWTITEGNAYLEGPLERNDTILENFIIPNATLVSTDKIVNVLFRESGLQTVNMFNSFRDSVSYRTSQGDIPSIKVGNLYVIDTTFVVDVYDTIVPVIDIRQNGVSVAFRDTTDVITVEAGDFLEFVDLSTKDRVTSRAWRIEDNGVATDSASLFQFKKLGEFKGVADLTRSGQNIPFDFERYEIPATFRVVPSSKPFVVSGAVVELEDETIRIPFNGEFAPFGSQDDFFTVTLKDPDNGDRELGISSISINSQDATFLEITLNEPIYRPDVITVSYDGNGTLESTDTRKPVAFSDLPVTMHAVNIWDDDTFSMEDPNQLAWESTNNATVEYSTEQASEGSFSIKLTNVEDGGFTRASSEPVDVTLRNIPEGGEYTFTWDVYIPAGNTSSHYGPWIYWEGGDSQKWQGINQTCCGVKPRDVWFTQSVTQTVTAGPGYVTFRIPSGGTIYFDNVNVYRTERRP